MENDRYIFILRKDGKHSNQVFSWVKGLFPELDNSTPTCEDEAAKGENKKPFLRWTLVSEDFGQVCSPPAICQWLDLQTLKLHIQDKTVLSDGDEETQNLDTFLHNTADSIPCIGCSVQMYIFLHRDDVVSEESYVPLAGAVLRLVKWLHVRTVVVKMESELSPLGHQLVDMSSGRVMSITEDPQPVTMTWSGEVTVKDEVKKEGVVFRAAYFSDLQWETFLNESYRPSKCVINDRGSRPSQQLHPIVCSHTIEVLQEVNLNTVPWWQLMPKCPFYLHFSETGKTNDLVKYVNRDRSTGLIGRVRAYRVSKPIPLCGDTSHLSTSAWKEFVVGGGSTHAKVKQVPFPYEYVHLLITPNLLTPAALLKQKIPPSPSKSSSSSSLSSSPSSLPLQTNCLSVRIIHGGLERLAGVMLEHGDPGEYRSYCALRYGGMQGKRLDACSVQREKTMKVKRQEEKDEKDENLIKSLPVFKAKDFLLTLHEIEQQKKRERERREEDEKILGALRSGVDAVGRLMHAMNKVLQELVGGMQTEGHTLADDFETSSDEEAQWVSEATFGVEECPEYKALAAGRHGSNAHSTPVDSQRSSSSAALLELKSFEKTGSKEFSIDNILSLFKAADDSGLKAKLDRNPLTRLSSGSVAESPRVKKAENQLDVYCYDTEEDYKYAQIRDQADFSDTLSSFVSPKKKAVKHFRPSVLPTRSSPRTKLFARKLSSSRSPPKLSEPETSRSTFKQPQSLQGSSSSSHHRKRLHSSITPDNKAYHSPPSQYGSSSSSFDSNNYDRHARKHAASSHCTPTSSHANTSSGHRHRKQVTPELNLARPHASADRSLHHKRPASSSFTPDPSDPARPFKFARMSTPSPSSHSVQSRIKLEPTKEISPVVSTSSTSFSSPSSSLSSSHKRVPFTTVLEMPESGVRRSPRKLPQFAFTQSMKISESAELTPRCESRSKTGSGTKQNTKSTSPEKSAKMKRSERHMMRLKSIIAKVLTEKGVRKEDPIYPACSKNLLNVSIVLLKSLPNSQNLTAEMKSVVDGQVQQIINLEKRRSGIAL